MLNYSEEDIKNAAELRDWVLKQLSDKQEEIDRLKRLLLLIDNLLKQESFKPASKLERSLNNTASSIISAKQEQVNRNKPTIKTEYKKHNPDTLNENVSTFTETRELKRLKDNLSLAKVNISSQTIEIKRILEGMITQDRDKNHQNDSFNHDLMNYFIDEHEGRIKKITINNYREKERLTDIINTSAWVFTRMLEKDSTFGNRT